jgi:septum formation protein
VNAPQSGIPPVPHPFLPPLPGPLVLASQSPRRAHILTAQQLAFRVDPSDADETPLPGELPAPHVLRLAMEKARAVAARHPEAVTLACDTVVVLDGAILGKPRDPEHALQLLGCLAGREHQVYSGVALVAPRAGFARADHDVTVVRFRAAGEAELRRYVDTGEPADKAGAYGIQGHGAMLVDGIVGCYFNVMGMPLVALRRLWMACAGQLEGRAG